VKIIFLKKYRNFTNTRYKVKFDPDFPIIKAEQGFEHPICGVAFELRVGVSPCLSPPPHCSLKFDPDFPIIKAEQGFEHPIFGRGFWAAGRSFPLFVPSTTTLLTTS